MLQRQDDTIQEKLVKIAVGAAKEFRPRKGQTPKQLRNTIASTASHAKMLGHRYSTELTPDGVRVTRVE